MRHIRNIMAGIMLVAAQQIAGHGIGETTVYYPTLPAPLAAADTLTLALPGAQGGSCLVQARVGLTKVSPMVGESRQWWRVILTDSAGRELSVTPRLLLDDFDSTDRRMAVEIEADGTTLSRTVSGAFSSDPKSFNLISVVCETSSGRVSVSGGCEENHEITTVELGGAFSPVAVHVTANTRAEATMIAGRVSPLPQKALASGWNNETLEQRLASPTASVEGKWTYLDRTNEPDYARPGGRYTLAVVRNSNDTSRFDIVYLGGAEINPDGWEPYMLKGTLTPTPGLENSYTLTWYDATFNVQADENFATLSESPRLLTLDFPLLKATFRFTPLTR